MEHAYAALDAVSIVPSAPALRDTLVADITATVAKVIAHTEATVRQMADQARQQFETAESALLRQIAEAHADLEAERKSAAGLADELAKERTARQRAEASYAEAQALKQQISSAYDERLRSLTLELEALRREAAELAAQLSAESAERARAAGVLDSIRTALVAVGIQPSPSPSPSGPGDAATTSPAPAAEILADAERADPQAPPSGVDVDEPSADAARTLKFITRPQAEARPHLKEYAARLLEHVETSYWQDVESLQHPTDVVTRLVDYLRTARELYVARCQAEGELSSADEFQRQLSTVLDTKGSTSFGRHLAIAWYEVNEPAGRAAACAVAS
jgi:hypothetical protein